MKFAKFDVWRGLRWIAEVSGVKSERNMRCSAWYRFSVEKFTRKQRRAFSAAIIYDKDLNLEIIFNIFFLLNKCQAAEAGNLDEFIRLFQFDNSRLFVQDGKGRTVAHQAAARNKLNILQFIHEQGAGNF